MKSRNSYFLILAVLTGLYCSCKPAKHHYERKDSDLALQLETSGTLSDTSGFEVKVRISPGKTWVDKGVGHDKSDFYYHSDSCFYLMSAKQGKVYAALVEPIANGVSYNLDYLVDFDTKLPGTDSVYFVYHDRFINKKIYSIKLTE